MKSAAVIIALALATPAAAQDDAVVTRPLRGLRGPVAALLATGAESGGWPAALAAWPHGDRLLFVVDAATAGRDAKELEVYAYATDAAGRVVGFVAEAVPVPADADGVRFVGAARRPAGEGSLRVLVVEPRTLRYRLLVAVVEDGATAPPLAAPSGRWTLARPAADAATAGAPDGDLLDVTVDGRPLAERLRESAGVPAAPAPPEAAPPSVGESELPDARKRRARALAAMARRGYLEVLDRLAAGVVATEAAALLVPVETAVRRLGAVDAAAAASRDELATAAELGDLDAETLLPIALLHLELFRRLAATEEHYLADSARRETSALAELYAARSDHPQAARLSARILLLLAEETTVREESRRLLERALALDGGHGVVRRAVATSYEREARYAEAVEVLAELVERDPGDAEARLRLALNLARVGRKDTAAGHLERLLADRHPDWILAVAYQELARLRAAAGRGGEAVDLLRRAVERLPREPRLALQLAWLLERGGSPAAARQLVAGLVPAPAGDSPRRRYGGGSEEALGEIRRALTEQAQLRLAALAGALARVDRHDGGRSDTTKSGPTRRNGADRP